MEEHRTIGGADGNGVEANLAGRRGISKLLPITYPKKKNKFSSSSHAQHVFVDDPHYITIIDSSITGIIERFNVLAFLQLR